MHTGQILARIPRLQCRVGERHIEQPADDERPGSDEENDSPLLHRVLCKEVTGYNY